MTYPATGRFGGRASVVPVAPANPAPDDADPDQLEMAVDDQGRGSGQDQLAAPADLEPVAEPATQQLQEVPAEQATAEEEVPPATENAPTSAVHEQQTASPEEAPEAKTSPPAKPKRSTPGNTRRTRKPAATKEDCTLVVIRDGQVMVSEPDAVVVDLDAASADSTDAAAIVTLIASLKPTADSAVRDTALAALKDLVADKALA